MTTTATNKTARIRGWSKDQVRIAAMAARAAEWNEQRVRMVLGMFGNRAVHDGRLTRTSPRLNNDDFEFYMSVAEADAGGVLPGWQPGHWRKKANQVISRQRRKIEYLAGELYLSEAYLNGVIDKATGGAATCLADLDQLNDRAVAGKVIEALKYKSKRVSGVGARVSGQGV